MQSNRRVNNSYIIKTLTQKFFAYFFTKKYGACFRKKKKQNNQPRYYKALAQKFFAYFFSKK